MEFTPNDLAQVNPAYWSELSRIKLQKGYWSFEKRQYLREPMESEVRRRCFMKGTQGGFTEMEVNRSLHQMIFGRCPRGVLYLFPTTWDVSEFSKARFGPLIAANPHSMGKYVQNTDTTSLKKVGESFLFLRGGTLSTHLEAGANEASKLRSISVDKVVFDELDLMDPDAIEKAKGRMGDSDVKEEVYISNPTLPDFGIANVFEKSDQRHWFRKCNSCNEWTCAEIEFPNCVKYKHDGTGYIACKKCGNEVFIDDGQWVAAIRDNSAYMHGYRWSQLSSYRNDPGEILKEYNDPPDGNLGDVIRLRLGLPYVAVEDKLRESDVLECCGDYPMFDSHAGPCAMGIDCQKPKRYLIGIRTGQDKYQLLRMGYFDDTSNPDPDWYTALDLVRRFHVKSCIVDIRPYEDSARVFQRKALKLGCKVYLCEYMESTPLGSMYNDSTGIVKVNRTEIHDATHRMVTTRGKMTIPRRSPEVLVFAKQVSACAKVLETNKKTKQQVYRYRGKIGGPDDYRHCLNYFYLAASGGKVGMSRETGERTHRQRQAINRGVAV
jgi:hypothetical protein